MPLPWLQLIDGVLGATDLVRWVRNRSSTELDSHSSSGGVDMRLGGVVIAALKEVFERDHERLEIERQRIEEERRRAERAMHLELLRQAGDREIGRLRLLAGVAVASLLGTLFLVTRLVGGAPEARVALGIGWLLLIAALAASFAGQSSVARLLGSADERSTVGEVSRSSAGAAASWLIVTGLASIALGVLLA